MSDIGSLLTNKKEETSLSLAIISIVITLVSFVPMMMYSGYVTSMYWEWFMMPIFLGLPAMTYLQGIGVNLVLSLMRGYQVTKDDIRQLDPTCSTNDRMSHAMAQMLLFWPSAHLLGYIVYSCIT